MRRPRLPASPREIPHATLEGMPSPVTAIEQTPDVLAHWEAAGPAPEHYLRVMAHRPEILRAFAPFYQAVLGPGLLDSRLKILAYLGASYANECPYCVARTYAEGRAAGFSETEIRAVQTEQDHGFKPIEQAVLHVARELTRTCSLDDISEEELSFFAPGELVELISVIALANFDNRFTNALEVEADKSK